MPRPFNRRQALENAAFLAALRRTGNARLAARELGVHRSTYTKRRAKDAAFATEWDAALAFAHAALVIAGAEGTRQSSTAPKILPGTGRGTARSAVEGRRSEAEPLHEARQSSLVSDDAGSPRRCAPRDDGRKHHTTGGEPHLVRLRTGRLQLRRAPPGRMTSAAEQAFFTALSATANIRLAAAAAGFAHSSFYARKRRDRAFAREMRLALEMGYDRLELALLATIDPESHEHDGWRHNDPPPIPAMSASEALQLLYLHQKQARLGWDQPHRNRRRGESPDVYVERLRAMWTNEKAREAEDRALARAERYEQTGNWRLPHEPSPPELPPLDLVLDDLRRKRRKRRDTEPARPELIEGKQPKNPDRALFGGWRIEDWERKKPSGR